MPNDTIDFTTKPCPRCGETAVLKLSKEGAIAYNQGAYIQDAFPDMSSADRERLMTGICGPCWDALFPPEDEEDEAEMSWCPIHEDQEVMGHEVSNGPDPYDIQRLACGDRVIWMSGNKEDCHVI